MYLVGLASIVNGPIPGADVVKKAFVTRVKVGCRPL